jgi:hypothetical protein
MRIWIERIGIVIVAGIIGFMTGLLAAGYGVKEKPVTIQPEMIRIEAKTVYLSADPSNKSWMMQVEEVKNTLKKEAK